MGNHVYAMLTESQDHQYCCLFSELFNNDIPNSASS
jgi:hypothetical protein